MASYVVYDTLLGADAARPRKVRVDKYAHLDEAKRFAQLHFIRTARGSEAGETASVERVTVETLDGDIVYELPSANRN